MIGLDIKANIGVDSNGPTEAECEKLEIALHEFFKSYTADSGEVLGYQVNVKGSDVSDPVA